MALNNSVYGQVGTPRVYMDVVQYAKAIGYVQGYALDGEQVGDPAACWDFNPSNIKRYGIHQSAEESLNKRFLVLFKNHPDKKNRQFAHLMSNVNYYGALGHTFGVHGVDRMRVTMAGYDTDGTWYGDSTDFSSQDQNEIVGDPNDRIKDIGFTLHSIDKQFEVANDSLSSVQIMLNKHGGWQPDILSWIDIGSFTIGRYLDFPNSPDLSVKLNFDYSGGINTKRTVGGSDITNIVYHKPPDWGSLPAWQHVDTAPHLDATVWAVEEDYRAVSRGGRRSWQIKFSYVDKEDMFPKYFDGNISGEYSKPYINQPGTFDVKDNILNTFFGLSLGGSLKFIFQPDKTRKDFCFCLLDKNSVSINQVAHGVYDISLTFVETW